MQNQTQKPKILQLLFTLNAIEHRKICRYLVQTNFVRNPIKKKKVLDFAKIEYYKEVLDFVKLE